jgi:hypothetical protein
MRHKTMMEKGRLKMAKVRIECGRRGAWISDAPVRAKAAVNRAHSKRFARAGGLPCILGNLRGDGYPS